MANLTFLDEANDFRIEIVGSFCGSCVADAEVRWLQALSGRAPKRVTVDISQLAGYENPGRILLRRMHRHGAAIAASTPRSLLFLAEITASRRLGPLPSVVSKAPALETRSRRPSLAAKTAGAGGG